MSRLHILLLNLLGANIKLKIGKNVNIHPSVRIDLKRNSKLIIGNNVFIDRYSSIQVYNGASLNIGNNCHFSQGCILSCNKEINIGDYSIFGYSAIVIDANHTKHNGNWIESELKVTPITIGKNVWICSNAVISRGAIITDNAIVPANEVVR